MSEEISADNKELVKDKDTRIACKYGTKCYQRNPAHLETYMHPPAKRYKITEDINQPAKKMKIGIQPTELKKVNIVKKAELEEQSSKSDQKVQTMDNKVNEEPNSENQKEAIPKPTLGRTPKSFDSKEFIKEKFLVNMPEDFYTFWNFCKCLKEKCPQDALKEVGLSLVGPYDVLAGKFYDIEEKPPEDYLIHWRYFYDPPEFQTVLKGDDRTGYHIGFFRDSPEEMPVFLANNYAKSDGVFKVMGDNIFAAVSIYLEDLKKTGDPFKKMHIGRFQGAIKKKAEEIGLELTEETQKIRDRDKKIVTRSFSKMGIVIPYNRKTQVGYRELSVSNKELMKILTNIQKALPEQRKKFLSDLQNVMTNTSIATDECDFGTGIELGLDILAHGVDCLNLTALRFLASNYRLIGREAFAKIAEAHMNNRRKGTSLSII